MALSMPGDYAGSRLVAPQQLNRPDDAADRIHADGLVRVRRRAILDALLPAAEFSRAMPRYFASLMIRPPGLLAKPQSIGRGDDDDAFDGRGVSGTGRFCRITATMRARARRRSAAD